MIENLKKKVFHLFLGISLKRRLFITYLLLSSLILMLTSVFFYTASKKVLIKRAALSSQQQLSLITSNLGEKIDNISNYAITLSINSNIADVLKENPTVPENTLEHFLVNSELTRPGPAYHRTSQKHLCLGYPGYRKPLVSQQYHRNRSA